MLDLRSFPIKDADDATLINVGTQTVTTIPSLGIFHPFRRSMP